LKLTIIAEEFIRFCIIIHQHLLKLLKALPNYVSKISEQDQ